MNELFAEDTWSLIKWILEVLGREAIELLCNNYYIAFCSNFKAIIFSVQILVTSVTPTEKIHFLFPNVMIILSK